MRPSRQGWPGAAVGLATVVLALAGCSSSSTSDPSANAGADRAVPVGIEVTLDGTASRSGEGGALAYEWTVTSRPAGSQAQLSSTGAASPTLTPDRIGAYVFSLRVHEGGRTSPPDQVTITAANTPPAVSAGPAQQLEAGQTSTLAASVTDADGHPVEHSWTVVSKPFGSAAGIPADAALDATFATDVEGTYVLRLVGSDGWEQAASDVTLTAAPRFTGGAVDGTTASASADLTALATRLSAVLALGYNTVNADAVAKQLFGKDPAKPASALTVLDVRSAADFAAGHVPGAVNVPFARLPAALLGNPGLLGTNEVVVASYNGGDGNMGSLLVNLARVADPVAQKNTPAGQPLPYPISRALFGGMPAWSFDRGLSPTRFDDDLGVRRIVDGPTEAAATVGVDQGSFPAYAAFGAAVDDVARKALVRARDYLARLEADAIAGGDPRFLWTDFVRYQALIADAEPANDPQLLSVRNAPDYAKGHVPGAIDIPYQQVANLSNTRYLATGKKVFVYCYTGHTGGLATMALGILGYEARNLLYGLNGYTLSPAVSSGQLNRFDVARAWDFPLHDTGGGIESLATYVPPATGCQGCHTNLTALYGQFNYTEPPAPGVASEGEG